MRLPESPSTQVVVTPAMIVAGNDAIAGFWVDLTTDRGLAAIPDAVIAAYKAMELARRQTEGHPHTLADCAS